jgi:type I restriction enzyme S subunit
MERLRFKDDNGKNYIQPKKLRLDEISFSKSSNITQNSLKKFDGTYPVYGANSVVGFLNDYEQDEDYSAIIKDGAGVGRIAFIPGKSSIIGTMNYILPKSGTNPIFLNHLLNKLNFDKFIIGSTIPHIYFKDYGKLKIYLPEIKEQEKIGNFLSLFDRLLEKINEKIDLLKELKKGYLQQMFPAKGEKVPMIRFREYQDDWEQSELWELTIWDKKFNEVNKKKQPRVIKYPYVLADKFESLEDNFGEILLLSTGTYVGFTTEEKAKSNICEGEIVAIPWGGTPNIKYWQGKFVTADNRIATSSDIQILRNKFMYFWMKNQINTIEKAYRGASIKHPSMKDILNMKVLYPCVSEQDKISALLSDLDKLVKFNENNLRNIDNFKKGYMQRLFA